MQYGFQRNDFELNSSTIMTVPYNFFKPHFHSRNLWPYSFALLYILLFKILNRALGSWGLFYFIFHPGLNYYCYTFVTNNKGFLWYYVTNLQLYYYDKKNNLSTLKLLKIRFKLCINNKINVTIIHLMKIKNLEHFYRLKQSVGLYLK